MGGPSRGVGGRTRARPDQRPGTKCARIAASGTNATGITMSLRRPSILASRSSATPPMSVRRSLPCWSILASSALASACRSPCARRRSAIFSLRSPRRSRISHATSTGPYGPPGSLVAAVSPPSAVAIVFMVPSPDAASHGSARGRGAAVACHQVRQRSSSACGAAEVTAEVPHRGEVPGARAAGG